MLRKFGEADWMLTWSIQNKLSSCAEWIKVGLMLIPVGHLKMKLMLEDDFSVPFKQIIIIFTQTISTFLYIVLSCSVLTGRSTGLLLVWSRQTSVWSLNPDSSCVVLLQTAVVSLLIKLVDTSNVHFLPFPFNNGSGFVSFSVTTFTPFHFYHKWKETLICL